MNPKAHRMNILSARAFLRNTKREENMAYSEVVRLFEARDAEPAALISFLGEIAEEDLAEEKKELGELFKKSPGDPGAAHTTIVCEEMDISFAAGFIYGQMFDISDKEVRASLEDLKERLIDGGMLKYQPRGAKAEDGPKGVGGAANKGIFRKHDPNKYQTGDKEPIRYRTEDLHCYLLGVFDPLENFLNLCHENKEVEIRQIAETGLALLRQAHREMEDVFDFIYDELGEITVDLDDTPGVSLVQGDCYLGVEVIPPESEGKS